MRPFDQPLYLILNFAVGRNLGGAEIDKDIFPQEIVFAYIRVYEN